MHSGSEVTIDASTISGNTATLGGDLYAYYSMVTITPDSTVTDKYAFP